VAEQHFADELPSLPGEWTWAKVDEIGDVVTGATPRTAHKEYYGGAVPFFTPSDLDVGYGVVAASRTLTPAGAEAVRPIPANSVLVTCIGATIGKTAFTLVSGATNQQINSIVCPDPVLAEYVFNYFSSPHGFQTVVEESSSTTLPIINKGDFSQLPVPIPPLKEAQEINQKVADLRLAQHELLREIAANEVRIGQLRQSVLSAAFRGQLT
jgi:type I restriction enzyme S subunit